MDSPYEISRASDELHYTYLDTFGRPVIVAHKSNLVEQHIQDIVVSLSLCLVCLSSCASSEFGSTVKTPMLGSGSKFLLGCVASRTAAWGDEFSPVVSWVAAQCFKLPF